MIDTAQKMKFPIKDFFSECDQICSFLPIWSHLLKKPLMENFIFLWSVKKQKCLCWLQIFTSKVGKKLNLKNTAQSSPWCQKTNCFRAIARTSYLSCFLFLFCHSFGWVEGGVGNRHLKQMLLQTNSTTVEESFSGLGCLK